MHTLTLTGVSFSYSGRPVLSDVNIEFRDGLTSLLGENGAGKTTLFKLLLGARPRFRGTIVMDGEALDPRAPSMRRITGYLPQEFDYPRHVTALELVSYVAWLRGIPSKRIPDAAVRALGKVGLAERVNARMGTLSGGMVRRVGIAQAMVHEPRLLLLDEPTSGLDPAQRVALRKVLAELMRETQEIMSTHLIEDAGLPGARVVILDGGRVRFQGTTEELIRQASPHTGGRNALMSTLENAFLTVVAPDDVAAS